MCRVMKSPAFRLVMTVVIFQMVLVLASLIGCFLTKSEKCDGSKATELLSTILASSFALYAAEK